MVFSAFERMVAMRYLRARRQEGFISVIAGFSLLGIALGVATLIIVMSVMNGFRAELLGRILGLNAHIAIYGRASGPIPDYDALVNRLRGLRDVVTAAPLVEGQVLATANGVASFAQIKGMRVPDLQARTLLSSNIKRGSLDAFTDDSVLIGTRMAARMGLAVGDFITLINPQGTATAVGTIPRVKAYRVIGLFEVGMYEYDNSYVYMPYETAQVFFRVPNGANAIEVMLDNPDRAGQLAFVIAGLVGPDLRVVDWQQAYASYFGAVQVERNVMFLILTLIILVAAFNIISSMIMLVKDKGRDIAILRTMGATRAMVLRIFFMSGASIGVIGTILGLILGVVFTLNIETIRQWLQSLSGATIFPAEIYFLSHLPAQLDWTEVTQVVVMALALSVLATIYPSWRAARLDPVEALRYE
ncbi:MAG TPA: lipoprotein-releasing ABC transporter permease subunit [Candidatus Sulfotelmatobacter sp.]|nr:lipoprotein-releasing ABC transporter permease subunit [Candidatus Sulfotelmatobacter sp.]